MSFKDPDRSGVLIEVGLARVIEESDGLAANCIAGKVLGGRQLPTVGAR